VGFLGGVFLPADEGQQRLPLGVGVGGFVLGRGGLDVNRRNFGGRVDKGVAFTGRCEGLTTITLRFFSDLIAPCGKPLPSVRVAGQEGKVPKLFFPVIPDLQFPPYAGGDTNGPACSGGVPRVGNPPT